MHARVQGITVSGVSSGGYMAVQFHVAHSFEVAAVGVLAAGPYYCAQGSLFTAYYNCMTPGFWTPVPGPALLKAQADALSAAGRIDPTTHLTGARVWLFSGTSDHTVYREVVEALRDFYAAYRAQIAFVSDKPAGHGMVTQARGNACGATRAPYIVHCGYDAAGQMLAFLFGKLEPAAPNEGGRLIAFDQNRYAGGDASAVSMDEIGFVYVPQSCTSRRCRIHVAFHGCRQGRMEVGEQFVREAGYNRWADTNDLIVLYPQVVKRYSPMVFNPRGCWDWWGYTSPAYHTKAGAQIRAVQAMVDRLAQ